MRVIKCQISLWSVKWQTFSSSWTSKQHLIVVFVAKLHAATLFFW